jgi:hypothetical protein
METKIFDLKRVAVRTFNREYGEWKKYDAEIILCEKGNYETYFGDSQIFRDYEELVKEYYAQKEKYPNHTFEKPICEIDGIAYGIEESEVEVIKKVFRIGGESKYLKTIYNRVQHYGGSEEGGWYYHTLEATSHNVNDFSEEELGTDRYGEGLDVYQEFYFGQHENLETQTYC